MTNKTTGLTLSEALATKRPFRRIGFPVWSKDPHVDATYTHNLYDVSVYQPIWEILPEEIAPMRVLIAEGIRVVNYSKLLILVGYYLMMFGLGLLAGNFICR